MHATEVFCQPRSAYVARTPINLFNCHRRRLHFRRECQLAECWVRDGPYVLRVAIIVLYLSPTTATTAAAQSGSAGRAVTKVNNVRPPTCATRQIQQPAVRAVVVEYHRIMYGLGSRLLDQGHSQLCTAHRSHNLLSSQSNKPIHGLLRVTHIPTLDSAGTALAHGDRGEP